MPLLAMTGTCHSIQMGGVLSERKRESGGCREEIAG
jgi:hypothetical protein